MTKFKPILDKATKRMGGAKPLEESLPAPKSGDEIKAVPDDRYLSAISLRVFQAGLKHSMVLNKWPAFEEVFHGFDPRRVAAMHDEQLEALMKDRRLVRHWPKIKSVPANAAAIIGIAGEAGSFGNWLADWPTTDITGLWQALSKRFNHMGGMSGPYILRRVGKDTFVLTDDVVRFLIEQGLVTKKPTGKRDLTVVQEAFNAWATETGRPLCQLSRIAALSLG